MFKLGKTVATPGALDVMAKEDCKASELLDRHIRGDWGDLCEEDRESNDVALRNGLRLFSCYRVGNSKLWVITEADRSVTTILRPEDY